MAYTKVFAIKKRLDKSVAYAIGVEFARQLFGTRFEVVIGTHLDKSHLHNHIVVNSVSFADGLKYHSSPESYYNEVRGTSDALCRENELSIITPKGHGKHCAEWKAEQDGRPTVRRGHDFKDAIAPDCLSFVKDHESIIANNETAVRRSSSGRLAAVFLLYGIHKSK